MCSTPKLPRAPLPLQEAKMPDLNILNRDKRRVSSGMAGGTLLTGSSGVSKTALNTAAPTLLGG
jgi:hypothetical protein